MNRSNRDSRRRNRNQGTAKSGHGRDNHLVIPDRWSDPRFYLEQINEFDVVTRSIHGRDFPFVVQPTRRDCFYACTVDDVAEVLTALPACVVGADDEDWERGDKVSYVGGVIFRQSTRKQEVLDSAWGRLQYAVDVGPIHGPAIYLEATQCPLRLRRSRRQEPEMALELERLLVEADRSSFDGRDHVLEFGLDAVRRVQLYRTLIHEVGHWTQFREEVDLPSQERNSDESMDEWMRLSRRYWARPKQELEQYAHRFAEEWGQRLRADGRLPFDRRVDRGQLLEEGLRPEDFLDSSAG